MTGFLPPFFGRAFAPDFAAGLLDGFIVLEPRVGEWIEVKIRIRRIELIEIAIEPTYHHYIYRCGNLAYPNPADTGPGTKNQIIEGNIGFGALCT